MTTSTERPVEPSRDARPPSAPRTARERARAEITAEILSAARRYLATDGAPALSLRAIARDLGMASSALYRYFGSRDELLTRLIVDAYDSLGAAAEASEAAVDRDDLPGRFAAVCRAVRTWALANPNEYALIYGSPVPGYQAPADTIAPAARSAVVFGQLISDAHAAGQLAPARCGQPVPQELSGDARRLRETVMPDVPDDVIVAALTAWAGIFGVISFELFGQFHNVVTGTAAYFDDAADCLARLMGLS